MRVLPKGKIVFKKIKVIIFSFINIKLIFQRLIPNLSQIILTNLEKKNDNYN